MRNGGDNRRLLDRQIPLFASKVKLALAGSLDSVYQCCGNDPDHEERETATDPDTQALWNAFVHVERHKWTRQEGLRPPTR